ncbi:MAG TPA: hypothetical protein VK929_02860 [Longimicrobiales bacterium]|nr:hypothetical protein [Longimicrobiales bacterium]
MRGLLPCTLALAALLLTARAASAHGITVSVEHQGDMVVATSRYDGGIPVRGADIVIRGPAGDSPYQTGRTDPDGRFIFVPAGPGEWQVTVDDGMGHRRTVRIAIPNPATLVEPETTASGGYAPGDVATATTLTATPTDEAALLAGPAGAGDGSVPWRLVTGLSLLFGITGIGYGYSARSRGHAST